MRTMTEISLMEAQLERAKDAAWVKLHAELRAHLGATPGDLTDRLGPAFQAAYVRMAEVLIRSHNPTEAECAAICREELVRIGVLPEEREP